MPEINFNLLNPIADLYSGPQVKMDPVAAYEKAKAARQSNMLAQLYAKHYDPQTGGVNYNALIGDAAQSDLAEHIPNIMKEAQTQAKSQADIAKTAAETESAKAEAGVRRQTSLEKKIGNARTAYESIYIPTDAELQTPEGKAAYNKAFNSFLNLHEDIHSDPEFQEMYTAKGGNKDDAYSQIMSTYGNPAAFRQLLMTAQMGTKNTLDALDAQKTQERLAKSEARQEQSQKTQQSQEDQRIALERRRVQIAEAQNKRDQQTFDQEQSTAGKLGITKAAYQKLESAYPASTAANESANFAIDSQIADLKALRDHKGLSSIAGPFDAATKGLQVTEDTTAAQALFDKVASGQTIQNLIDLRRASPTGAGLSSISDKDVAMLKEGTGLNQRQYTPALKAQINSAIEKLENAKEVMNKQYKTTYSYKSSAPSTPATDDKAQTQKLEDPLGIRKSKAK